MNRISSIGFVTILVFSLLFISAIPFIWHFKEFNLNKFSQYGGFVSGVISGITLILVVFAYKSTKEQVRLAQKQAFDSIFFNLLESHRSIVERLQSGKGRVLHEHCVSLINEIYSTRRRPPYTSNQKLQNIHEQLREYEKTMQSKDFFDNYYYLLDKEYKYSEILDDVNNETISPQSLVQIFFDKTFYLINHYIESLFTIIKLVDNNELLKTHEKGVYVSLLMNLITTDEKRVLFYFLIWKGEHSWWYINYVRAYDIFSYDETNIAEFNLINHTRDWEAYYILPDVINSTSF